MIAAAGYRLGAPPPPAPEFRPGSSRLGIRRVAGSSAVTTAYATSPMKLLVPRPRGISVWAYTSSFGGGLVAGDQTSLEIVVEPGARVFVGTQASSKVYHNRDLEPCGHQTTAHVGAGSLLVLAPDPAQLFADSTYRQRQEFHLAPEASLVLVDGFGSGRVARGERWDFNHYASRNIIRVGDRTVMWDALQLDPADGGLSGPFRGGRYDSLTTLVVLGPAVREIALAILAEVGARPVERRAALIVSASPLADGAVVRLAGGGSEPVARELHRWLTPLGPLLGDEPWRRKW